MKWIRRENALYRFDAANLASITRDNKLRDVNDHRVKSLLTSNACNSWETFIRL